ncbi:hypothetical protein FSHL1_012495 [Fusarium sambucinum]
MSSQNIPPSNDQDFQICDPSTETRAFTLFSKLPYDIRHMIWEKAIEYNRIIKIQLAPSLDPSQCEINVPWPQEMIRDSMPSLLATCSDSRQIATTFYRVCLPCYYKRPDGTRRFGTLHLCPEMDIIHVDVGPTSDDPWDDLELIALDHIAALCNLVYSKDAQQKGLLHLALPVICGFKEAVWNVDILKAALPRLLRIIFVKQNQIQSNNPRPSLQDECLPQASRSIQTCGSIITLDRLRTASRSIRNELEEVHIGSNYFPGYGLWYNHLRWMGVEPDNLDVKWRFLLPFTTNTTLKVTHRESVVSWLGPDRDSQRKTPLPAVGFWIFPLRPVMTKLRWEDSINMRGYMRELYAVHLG